jgi:hypothetical protein
MERYHGADGDVAAEARESMRLVRAIRAVLAETAVGVRGRTERVDLDELAIRDRAVMLGTDKTVGCQVLGESTDTVLLRVHSIMSEQRSLKVDTNFLFYLYMGHQNRQNSWRV